MRESFRSLIVGRQPTVGKHDRRNGAAVRFGNCSECINRRARDGLSPPGKMAGALVVVEPADSMSRCADPNWAALLPYRPLFVS